MTVTALFPAALCAMRHALCLSPRSRGSQILGRIRLKKLVAVNAAEIISLAFVFEFARSRLRLNTHAADWIDHDFLNVNRNFTSASQGPYAKHGPRRSN